jgi:hypothetical protein
MVPSCKVNPAPWGLAEGSVFADWSTRYWVRFSERPTLLASGVNRPGTGAIQ